jgi:general secretion pathway protein D
MTNLGVRLEVEPTVGADNYTIDLRLVPEVTEFEGFINYGSPIRNRGVEVTANVINYPVFSERKVETSVSVYDGATVILGGLMREDVQKVNDKTPLLGDIPFAGALIRSQADQHIKRNLVIFVTATLIDPAGQPMGNIQQDLEFPMEDMPLDATTASLFEPPLPQ